MQMGGLLPLLPSGWNDRHVLTHPAQEDVGLHKLY